MMSFLCEVFEEIQRLSGRLLITSEVKARRLQWGGHVARVPQSYIIGLGFDG